MSAVLELETEIWCPRCREVVGKVMRRQVGPDLWTHERTPKRLRPFCTRCETVLVRK